MVGGQITPDLVQWLLADQKVRGQTAWERGDQTGRDRVNDPYASGHGILIMQDWRFLFLGWFIRDQSLSSVI